MCFSWSKYELCKVEYGSGYYVRTIALEDYGETKDSQLERHRQTVTDRQIEGHTEWLIKGLI